MSFLLGYYRSRDDSEAAVTLGATPQDGWRLQKAAAGELSAGLAGSRTWTMWVRAFPLCLAASVAVSLGGGTLARLVQFQSSQTWNFFLNLFPESWEPPSSFLERGSCYVIRGLSLHSQAMEHLCSLTKIPMFFVVVWFLICMLCVLFCLHVPLFTMCIPDPHWGQKKVLESLELGVQMWAALWVLENKSGSFGKATSIPNSWMTFPIPSFVCFYFSFVLFLKQGLTV